MVAAVDLVGVEDTEAEPSSLVMHHEDEGLAVYHEPPGDEDLQPIEVE